MSNLSDEIWVGVDVCKAQLDVAVGEGGETWSSDNDEQGIARTVARCKLLQPRLVVVESTGGLESSLVSALYLAGVPVALVNPRRVREFAKAAFWFALHRLSNLLPPISPPRKNNCCLP
jgi:transposase